MKHVARWAILFMLLLVARGWVAEQADLARTGASSWSSETAALLQAAEVVFSGPAALFVFSRIAPNRVMEHETRTKIRELVAARPGIGLSEVSQALELGWGTAVYHINRMEAAGLVSSSASGRRRALFLPEHGRVTREALTVLSSNAQVRLLSYVRDKPGCSQRELAAAANLSLPLAHRYMARLEDEGLVVSEKTWRTRAYQPTAALTEFLGVHALRQKSETLPAHLVGSAASAASSPGGTHAFSNSPPRQAV